MRHLVRFGVLALGSAALVSASGPVPDMEAAVQAAMAETGAKGVAVALIDKGQVVSVKSWGVRNAKGDPLQDDTVMYGASLTKAVFGYLVTQLASEGKIDLDKPIAAMLAKPIPDYGNVEGYGQWGDLAGDPRVQKVTPRHALNHATGFANFAFLEPDQKLKFHFDPGTNYAYSGEGISLLQFGVEKGLGLSVEAELQRRFFKPLGMTRTSLIWQDSFGTNLADGWNENGKAEVHDDRSRVRAAGSMDTTIHDLAQMTAAMVRGYGLPKKWRVEYARGTQKIGSKTQFPTLNNPAGPGEGTDAKAALGVVAFTGPQGAGWFKGGHNDTTANTLVCLERGQRCVLILGNDVRIEKAFPKLVRAALGETGVPYGWEYGVK
ncbi:beta-lactamase family protein [Sphingomonas sp. R-74633]|uniref:serine hydrolase domain-containing protein n=1 Tax=Sphingomonas sp. R-74633 TaxID=2751188 RepID=UPI0015D1401A|nr:serine hydrolase domain-containing protein [Sphingomonas sp. R-74633]NYT42712.1 beta-lactamase family protein [Sphingomonas sp. R-74633]